MATATFARFILLEARRGGLPWLALAAVAVALALAAFLSQVALTETRELQASVMGALLRASAAFLITVHVASSTVRELNDKGLELFLSFPLPRSTQYLGRLAGFAATAVFLALACALVLLAVAPLPAVALWGLSLAVEGVLVAAAALFFSLTLAQLVPAIAATAGLYMLARSMAAIQAMASSPLSEPSAAGEAARFAVDAVALLLPRLDAATRTEWLLYGASFDGDYARALLGMALYAVLVTAAGLFDFYRRSL